MEVAIIGAGNVGGALVGALTRRGHTVIYGVKERSAPKVKKLLAEIGPHGTATSVAEAARRGQVVILATPWQSTEFAIAACGDLTAKIVIDCTNPLAADLSGLTVGHTQSGAEQVAVWARGASVFKTFNQTGANNMADCAGYPVRPVMFVVGDDVACRPTVISLVEDVGFAAIDAGPLAVARLLEPLAMLWIHLALRQGHGRDIAFALVHRKE